MWQKRLQLDDWNVQLVISPQSDLRYATVGNIHWDVEKKTAVIHVLNAAEYRIPFPAAVKDMEFTIVHELLHLELASLPRTDESRVAEESAVNRMADALLKLAPDHS